MKSFCLCQSWHSADNPHKKEDASSWKHLLLLWIPILEVSDDPAVTYYDKGPDQKQSSENSPVGYRDDSRWTQAESQVSTGNQPAAVI